MAKTRPSERCLSKFSTHLSEGIPVPKKKSKYNNSFTSLKRYGNLSNSQRNICLCLEKKNHIILEIKTKLKPHLISGNIAVRFYKQLQKLSPLFMFESL